MLIKICAHSEFLIAHFAQLSSSYSLTSIPQSSLPQTISFLKKIGIVANL